MSWPAGESFALLQFYFSTYELKDYRESFNIK